MDYDIAIIGGGPAALTAAIYAGRAKKKTIVIGEMIPGGQTVLTDRIENYPGFMSVSGMDLMNNMYEQVKALDIDIKMLKVLNVEKEDKSFVLSTAKEQIKALAVIVCSGATYRQLGVEGEAEYTGKGVSYCGVCDAPFFKDKDIAIVGGGDTAVYEATHLLKFAKKIHMIHRRDRLRATKIMQDRVLSDEKTIMHWDSVAQKIYGENMVKGITIKNVKTGHREDIDLDGVFVFVGITPLSEIVKDIVDTTESGYILTDNEMKTSCDGLFACGDVRQKALRQVSTAVGEGAAAAFSAQQYVEALKGEAYI